MESSKSMKFSHSRQSRKPGQYNLAMVRVRDVLATALTSNKSTQSIQANHSSHSCRPSHTCHSNHSSLSNRSIQSSIPIHTTNTRYE